MQIGASMDEPEVLFAIVRKFSPVFSILPRTLYQTYSILPCKRGQDISRKLNKTEKWEHFFIFLALESFFTIFRDRNLKPQKASLRNVYVGIGRL